MSGTKQGWEKAKAKLIAKYGGIEGFHRSRQEIGREGGKISRGGGFKWGSEEARAAGRLGGSASRKSLAENTVPCPHCSGMYKNARSLSSHIYQRHSVSEGASR